MRARCHVQGRFNEIDATNTGYVVVHRNFPGDHETLSLMCWCGPFLIDPMDLRTDDEIADALNLWEEGH